MYHKKYKKNEVVKILKIVTQKSYLSYVYVQTTKICSTNINFIKILIVFIKLQNNF